MTAPETEALAVEKPAENGAEPDQDKVEAENTEATEQPRVSLGIQEAALLHDFLANPQVAGAATSASLKIAVGQIQASILHQLQGLRG